MEQAVSKRSFWPWLPLLTGVLSTYGPVSNNYGFALYFLTWRHGFVKRALVGEVFAGAPFLSRGDLLAIEISFIAAAYLATYALFRRILFGDMQERLLAALLLSAPALLPHIGYLFAQPDVTLYLIVLLCVALWIYLPARFAMCGSCLLSLIALLVHEAFVLMFYPLLLAILWRKFRLKEIALWAAVSSVAVVTGVWIMVVHFGVLKVAPDTVWMEALVRTNVPVQKQVYDVMASTLPEQWALVKKLYTPGVLAVLALTLVLSAPYFWLLKHLLGIALCADGAGKAERVMVSSGALSPLILCLFGHDTTRWIGAACINVSIYLLYLYAIDREGRVRTALREWVAASNVYAWIGYLVVIGPFGATGIRSAELLMGTGR